VDQQQQWCYFEDEYERAYVRYNDDSTADHISILRGDNTLHIGYIDINDNIIEQVLPGDQLGLVHNLLRYYFQY
jgi:hypothetical protein